MVDEVDKVVHIDEALILVIDMLGKVIDGVLIETFEAVDRFLEADDIDFLWSSFVL